MEPHHQQSIDRFLKRIRDDESLLAALLGGSIAHGFAELDSDIDLLLVVDEEEYEKRRRENKLAYSVRDICTYEGGYVDCKVIRPAFLEAVKERGSDPARYAFLDNCILLSRIDHLAETLEAITRFPLREKGERMQRFAAQLLAWKWYYGEGVKKENPYLIHLAIQKLVLFSCRLVLNANEMLYPYHKWLLKVTERAAAKPAEFDRRLAELLRHPDIGFVERFCNEVLAFAGVDADELDWPNRFLQDSELNWVDHEPPIDDL